MANTKFRAFHKPSKTMYWFDIMNGNTHGTGSGYISMTPFGEPITKFRHKDNLSPVDPEDCELMQFTGLHDKNGIEICEGDIIRIDFGIDSKEGIVNTLVEFENGMFVYNPTHSKQVVRGSKWDREHDWCNSRWFQGGTYPLCSGFYGYGDIKPYSNEGSKISVIGNIHESPELLNSKEVVNG